MKKLMFVFVLLCSITMIPGKAVAISLTLDPWFSVVNPGQSAYVNLRVSGLTVGGPDSLGAFDVGVTYNDTLLDFKTVWFSNWLGNPYGSNATATKFVDNTTPGELRLQEISWLFDWELDNLQTVENMVLAVITFEGTLPGGTSDLDFNNVVLSDAFGVQLPDPILQGSRVGVVPEPGTLLLLGSGLLGLAGLRKKFKIKSS